LLYGNGKTKFRKQTLDGGRWVRILAGPAAELRWDWRVFEAPGGELGGLKFEWVRQISDLFHLRVSAINDSAQFSPCSLCPLLPRKGRK